MRRQLLSLAALALLAGALAIPSVHAGRMEGPLVTIGLVPGGLSAHYDVNLTEGEPAVIAIVGNGNAPVELIVYDADGHVSVGTGAADRKTVILGVYRTGTFRVEVRNPRAADATFTLMTN